MENRTIKIVHGQGFGERILSLIAFLAAYFNLHLVWITIAHFSVASLIPMLIGSLFAFLGVSLFFSKEWVEYDLAQNLLVHDMRFLRRKKQIRAELKNYTCLEITKEQKQHVFGSNTIAYCLLLKRGSELEKVDFIFDSGEIELLVDAINARNPSISIFRQNHN